MINDYAARCHKCRCLVPSGAGVVVRMGNGLRVACLDHQDAHLTEAQRFVVANINGPPLIEANDNDPEQRWTFDDHSIATWNGRTWRHGLQ